MCLKKYVELSDCIMILSCPNVLEEYVELLLSDCIMISCPTILLGNKDVKLNVFDLRKKLINLMVPIILNDNINEIHLGKKGLHLNAKGSGRLATNYIALAITNFLCSLKY